MRNLILYFFLILSVCLEAQINPNHHKVRGYYRSDGTYVKSHYRTNPNSTNRDNYSTLGNVNPWTSKPGWIKPDNKPAPTYKSSSTPSYYNTPINRGYQSTTNYNSNTYNSAIGGQRTIYYSDGKEIFNVLPKKYYKLNPALIYYSYDASSQELKELQGKSTGNLLDGPYQFYDSKGTLRKSDNYRKGLQDGLSTLYNENGEKEIETYYDNGVVSSLEYKAENGNRVLWIGEPQQFGSRKKVFDGNILIEETRIHRDETLAVTTYSETTGKKESQYTIKNNDLHGPYTVFFKDGFTKKVEGAFLHGEKNGLTKEYGASGNLLGEYTLRGDLMDGPFIFYHENQAKRLEGAMKNGVHHGEIRSYNEDGELEVISHFNAGKAEGEITEFYAGKPILTGGYQNDKKKGTWKYYYVGENESEYYSYQYFNYENDILHGPFKSFTGDSLIIGNYYKGKLHGGIKIYRPIISMIVGTPPSIIKDDQLIAEGQYVYGKKDGHWTDYSIPRKVKSKGLYRSGLKEGEWKDYYPWILDDIDSPKSYAGKLFKVENYKHGKLDGPSTRYSYLKKEIIPCGLAIKDTCFDYSLIKLLERSNYKNGLPHGTTEVYDSLNRLVKKGQYTYGEKEGIWVESTHKGRREIAMHKGVPSGIYREYDVNDNILESRSYNNGKASGTWYTYLPGEGNKIRNATFHEDGARRHVVYRYDQTQDFEFSYDYDELAEMIVYAPNGRDIVKRFDVIDHLPNGYYFSVTAYKPETIIQAEIRLTSNYQKLLESHTLILGQFGDIPKINKMEEIKTEFHGEYEIRDIKNGQKLTKGEFTNGVPSGEWKQYYYDDQIIQCVTYQQGDIANEVFLDQKTGRKAGGKVSWINRKGLLEVVSIKKGLRHGKTITSSGNKEIKEVRKYRKGLLIK